MRIYIKGDYARKVQFGYRELAWKMWFKERNGQEISFSHVGDDEKTWLTIEEFKEKHQDILSLTFDKANEMSLEEIQTIDAIDDHIWEELDRKREEYIRIHGERVYGDEDNE